MDLGRCGGFGEGVVGLGDYGPTHDDFAGFAAWEFTGVGEYGDGRVGDGDDLDFDFAERATDTGAADGSGIDFVSGDGGDREGLGGTIGAVEFTDGQKLAGIFPERGGDRRTSTEDATQRGQREVLHAAVVADFLPERGRAEGISDVFLADGLNDFRGIDFGGTTRVDFGHDGGHAKRRVEQGEDREKRQVDFSGLNVVGVA